MLLDSTHKTNQWNWHLGTVYVQTEFYTWVPGIQAFFERETSEAIASMLLWAQEQCCRLTKNKWRPSYVLMDDSATESRGVSMAFGGIERGEIAVR